MRKLAAAFIGLASIMVPASPAAAVSPPTQATATARILRPLSITAEQNLDFGTIVLTGSSFTGQVVSISQAGAVTCGTNPGVILTCSGTTLAAQFRLIGTNNAIVKITSPGFNLTGPGTLAFTPNFPATVNLGANGASTGTVFSIGGSITLASTTPDGVYTGTFLVTADYQ